MSAATATPTPVAPALRLRPAAGWLVGAAVALGLNFGVLLAANLFLDGSVQVAQPGGDPEDLAAVAVVAASVLPLAVGALALAVLARILGAPRAFRLWTVVVAGVAVASIVGPATLPVATGSIVALAAMHLTTGAAAVLGQSLAARR